MTKGMGMKWGVVLGLAGAALLGGIGCSQAGFRSQKAELLQQTSVMGSGNSQGLLTVGESDTQQPSGSSDSSSSNAVLGGGQSNPVPARSTDVYTGESGRTFNSDGTTGDITKPPYISSPGSTSEPIVRYCSDGQSMSNTNFKKAVDTGASVELQVNRKTCTKDINVLKSLLIKNDLTLADLTALCGAVVPVKGEVVVDIIIDNKAPYYGEQVGSLTFLYALNTQTSPATQAADQYCTYRSSPLVIKMASDPNRPSAILLSSIADGIQFDLLGERANHRKVQIGWFTNHDYRLLALPNSRGAVNGIDELFGDNTKGPDGTFADDGYAALAKYDGKSADGRFTLAKADGIIDRRDPVFNRLSLWLDLNFDGKTQEGELTSLKEAGLSFIDLHYSNDFAESDKYGNETKMKSVVGYVDGTLDLIFDLWFAHR